MAADGERYVMMRFSISLGREKSLVFWIIIGGVFLGCEFRTMRLAGLQ